MLKVTERKLWSVSEAVYNASNKEYSKFMKVADRRQGKLIDVGHAIENRKFAEARRIYETNKDWMTLPKSALNLLYKDG